MENYNKLLRNIAELVEKGLISSKDLKKDIEQTIIFELENITNKMKLVNRDEFEVQKKIIEKLQKDIIKLKKKIEKKLKRHRNFYSKTIKRTF